MRPCRHLDYTEDYTNCTIQTCAPDYPDVRYWLRGGPGEIPPNPRKVQFCGAGRGRINGVFQCYCPGEMPCYEPEAKSTP
mgnify:FL=1